jgi:hypothetical protein
MVKRSLGDAATVVLLLCAVFTLEYGRARRSAAARPPGEGALQRSWYGRRKAQNFRVPFRFARVWAQQRDAVCGDEHELQRRNGDV